MGKPLGITLVLMLIVAGGWLLWPSSAASLSERDYEIALALYRVCNQRDVETLQTIEAQLDETDRDTAANPGHQALRAIVALARQEDWTDAVRRCRVLLDAQIET
ncbi:MAG: hypothetical protein AAF745_09655 [Planctomycetota bacterium]